jgi:ACS family tartrate transporter-like MFS transporter
MLLTVILFTMVGVNIAYLPVSWAIPTEILGASAAAASVGMINGVGSIAGFAGPYAFGWLRTMTGSFAAGLGVLGISAFTAGLLLLCVPRRQVTS